MFDPMLRSICVLVAAGLLLGACSGGAGDEQGTPDPASCTGGCGAGEVCSDGECRPGCRLTEDCDDEQACRDGACVAVVCGDGFEERDEECDNGDRNGDSAACTNACLDATCGDGAV